MSNLEHLQTLMAEIGPVMDRVDAIDQEGEDHWSFAFGDNVLHASYDDPARKLVFTMDVGTPAAEYRLPIYEALLSFNYLWSETGGVRMAIDGPRGEVTLVFDLFTLDLEVSTLATVIENFVETSAYWRGFIANFEPSAEPDATEAGQDEAPGGHGIRV